MRSRREVLGLGIAGIFGAGCLGSDAEKAAITRDDPADVGDPKPGGPVEIVQWGWPSGRVRDALDPSVPSSFDVTLRTFTDRRTHEIAIAERISEGRPPETFQTVTGDELRRYIVAKTVHPLPAISEHPFRPGVLKTVERDGVAHAVPVGVSCRNWFAVRRSALDRRELTGDDLATEPTIAVALSRLGPDAEMVVPHTATWQFQLFCLELLASSGPAGFSEIRNRSPRIGTIRPALERIVDLRKDGRLRSQRRSADAAIGAVGVPNGDWVPVQWPGTIGTVSISVMGFPFPKRARNAHGTVAVLDALASADGQDVLASTNTLLPARSDVAVPTDAEPIESQASWLKTSGTVVPSPATGCGLGADQRRRVLACFAPETVVSTPIDQFARKVRNALS